MISPIRTFEKYGCDYRAEKSNDDLLLNRMGATRMDFEASVAIHPTIAEEFVTFGGWGKSKDKDPRTVRKARACVRHNDQTLCSPVELLCWHCAFQRGSHRAAEGMCLYLYFC